MAGPEPAQYVGRFAPSPTGPLHFGSLLAALASYLQAKARGGRWLLRIEDIDPPRQQRSAIAEILRALERYGFEWDGPVIYQSTNRDRHTSIIRELLAAGLAYPCSCSRQDLAHARRGLLGAVYPGTCRDGAGPKPHAIRVKSGDSSIEFVDGLQGPQCQRLDLETGDFIIRRRDGLIAYHLAVVVDDFAQGITEIVRGSDLLDSTPSQIHLQRLLRFPTPDYLHIPVAQNAAGQKLSKQTGAPAIPLHRARATLASALGTLGQEPPPDLAENSLADLWAWAVEHWQPGVLAHRRAVPAPACALARRENGLS